MVGREDFVWDEWYLDEKQCSKSVRGVGKGRVELVAVALDDADDADDADDDDDVDDVDDDVVMLLMLLFTFFFFLPTRCTCSTFLFSTTGFRTLCQLFERAPATPTTRSFGGGMVCR